MAATPQYIDSLGGYTFVQILGSGVYGVVAKYVKDGMAYTIKFIQARQAGADFMREVEVLHQLNAYAYPIPKFYAWGSFPYHIMQKSFPPEELGRLTNATYYGIILEFIAGTNLLEHLRQNNGVLDAYSIYNIAEWMFNLLRALHALELVHRDIKPENIIITPDQRLYLVDFGFACSLTQEEIQCPVRMIGSPYYLAPEIRTQTLKLDKIPATDIWSAGVTLYEVLNYKLPWDIPPKDAERYQYDFRQLDAVLRYQLLNFPPRPGHTLHPVSDVIDLALTKSVATRPSAADLYAILIATPIPPPIPPTL